MIELTAKPRVEGEFFVGDEVFSENATPDGHPHAGVVVAYFPENLELLVCYPDCEGMGHDGSSSSEVPIRKASWWVPVSCVKLLD